jgi:hypothetical protein
MVFQQLDEYLNKEFSPDLWSDHAVIYAIDLVQKMTPADWDSLKSCWRDRRQEWQYRCAEIISDADSQQVIPLLLEMLQTPDDRLTITAVDSLRSIGIAEQNVYLNQDVLKRLQILSENSSITEIVVNELLKQLQVRL